MQLTAFLFGIPVLGGQIPLSTFAQADPEVRGYGLGADSAFISTLIGLYVITLAIGAFTLPLTSRWLGVRRALVVACSMVGLGYLLWLPFHEATTSGADQHGHRRSRVRRARRRPPAAAAAAAPPDRTGIATGMTNGTKTLGGAIASAIFAIALTATGSLDAAGEQVAPLSGLPHRVGGVLRSRLPRGAGPARRAPARVLRPAARGARAVDAAPRPSVGQCRGVVP